MRQIRLRFETIVTDRDTVKLMFLLVCMFTLCGRFNGPAEAQSNPDVRATVRLTAPERIRQAHAGGGVSWNIIDPENTVYFVGETGCPTHPGIIVRFYADGRQTPVLYYSAQFGGETVTQVMTDWSILEDDLAYMYLEFNFQNGLLFQGPEHMAHLDAMPLEAVALDTGDCVNPTWQADMPVHLSIESGSQYGQLYSYGNPVGADCSVSYFSIRNGYVDFSADGDRLAIAETARVVIRAKVGNEDHTISIMLGPPNGELDLHASRIYVSASSYDESVIRLGETLLDTEPVEFPPEMKINLTLMWDQSPGGRPLGVLVDAAGDTASDVLSTTIGALDSGLVKFISNDVSPQSITDVGICARAAVNDNVEGFLLLHVTPRIVVSYCPSTLAPGDTANVIVAVADTNCGSNPLTDPSLRFDAGFEDESDTLYARLINPCDGTIASTLSSVPLGFQVVAASDTVPPEGHVISLWVGISANLDTPCEPPGVAVRKAFPADTGVQKPQFAHGAFVESRAAPTRRSRIVNSEIPQCSKEELTIGEVTILLGESKYFGTRICNEGTKPKLAIYEITNFDPDGKPDAAGALSEDVWGQNPITVVSGGKSGVYWDQKYPTWKTETNKQGASETHFDKCKDLPIGVLRVLGRYMDSAGSTPFIVRVEARTNESSEVLTSRIDIRVARPTKLGTKLSKGFDVISGEEFSVDDFAIQQAAESGIPPQFIKAQIVREAHHEQGKSYPTYRYEPFMDIQFRIGPYSVDYLMSPFLVNPAGMDPDDVPSEDMHHNVKPTHYPETPNRWGDYLANHLSFYLQYPRTSLPGFLIPPKMNPIQNFLTGEFREAYMSNLCVCACQAPDDGARMNAEQHIKQFLKENFGDYGSAQTRKCASYSMLQMLYTSALGYGYARNYEHKPEDLNDLNIEIPMVIRYYRKMIQTSSNPSTTWESSTWPSGLEEVWKNLFGRYNPTKGYNTITLAFSRDYLPSK